MRTACFMIVFLVVTSCGGELTPVPVLEVDLDQYAAQTVALSDSSRHYMDGVYAVEHGSDLLGSTVTGTWEGNRWCLRCEYDVVYSENAGGSIGDTISFIGFIRIVRSGQAESIELSVEPHNGGRQLALGVLPDEIILTGTTRSGQQLRLRRLRAPYQPLRAFHVLAHRGGGRNSERLGLSENSIAMVRYASILGATGVEIDIKRTKDGALIVFHDETFSPRTVTGAYLLGRVDDFDLQDIKRYGQLVNGEAIPTLDEMLTTIIDSTSLNLVWLDVKDASAIDGVIKAQQEARALASIRGRSVDILIGIPTDEVYSAFKQHPASSTSPFLYELDVNTALNEPMCRVWAPRWTNGIPSDQIQKLHAQGKLVFTWTLDVRDYISEFLYHSEIDGILTNYPSLVSAMHMVR